MCSNRSDKRNPAADAFTVIAAARDTVGRSTAEIRDRLDAVAAEFSQNVKARFKAGGEW